MELSDREIAANLRKPDGKAGEFIAVKMNEGNLDVIGLTYRAVQRFEGHHILEVGFGNGLHLKDLITSPQTRLHGLDYSETMIKQAQQRNAEPVKSGQLQLSLGAAEEMPFHDNAFDRVCTVNTLYFWSPPEKVLREFKRVTKPGGVVAIGFRAKAQAANMPFTQYGFTLYDPPEVQTLIEPHGFSLVDHLEEPHNERSAHCMVFKVQ